MSQQTKNQVPKTNLGFSWFLVQEIARELNKRCDKCNKPSDNLERANPHSDFVYCSSCLQQQETLK